MLVNAGIMTVISFYINKCADNISKETLFKDFIEETQKEDSIQEVNYEQGAYDLIRPAKSVILVLGQGFTEDQNAWFLKTFVKTLLKSQKSFKFVLSPQSGYVIGYIETWLRSEGFDERLIVNSTEFSDYQSTDLAIVMGANDSVNPRAIQDKDSIIYETPVVRVWECKKILVIKRSLRGLGLKKIDNPLFRDQKCFILSSTCSNALSNLNFQMKRSQRQLNVGVLRSDNESELDTRIIGWAQSKNVSLYFQDLGLEQDRYKASQGTLEEEQQILSHCEIVVKLGPPLPQAITTEDLQINAIICNLDQIKDKQYLQQYANQNANTAVLSVNQLRSAYKALNYIQGRDKASSIIKFLQDQGIPLQRILLIGSNNETQYMATTFQNHGLQVSTYLGDIINKEFDESNLDILQKDQLLQTLPSINIIVALESILDITESMLTQLPDNSIIIDPNCAFSITKCGEIYKSEINNVTISGINIYQINKNDIQSAFTTAVMKIIKKYIYQNYDLNQLTDLCLCYNGQYTPKQIKGRKNLALPKNEEKFRFEDADLALIPLLSLIVFDFGASVMLLRLGLIYIMTVIQAYMIVKSINVQYFVHLMLFFSTLASYFMIHWVTSSNPEELYDPLNSFGFIAAQWGLNGLFASGAYLWNLGSNRGNKKLH